MREQAGSGAVSVLGVAGREGTWGHIRMQNIDELSGMSYSGVRTSSLRPQEEIPSDLMQSVE